MLDVNSKEFIIDEIIDDALDCKFIDEDAVEQLKEKLANTMDYYIENYSSSNILDFKCSHFNDARFAPYKHPDKGWCNICLQDFDFKDYTSENFALPKIDSEPEYDAFQLWVSRVAVVDNKYIIEFYDLAEKLIDLFVDYKRK